MWAAIPPGFMEDSAVDPVRAGTGRRTGCGTRWCGTVRAGRCGSIWTRRGWPTPGRVWPVRVDPSMQNYAPETDDTFVSSHD